MERDYQREFTFSPPQATSTAAEVDWLYYSLVGMTVFFTLLICAVIVTFLVRYRSTARLNRRIHVSHKRLLMIEIGWMLPPLAIVMGSFFWGAAIFFDQRQEPADPLRIYVVGKQWMWKVQHEGGRREINSLHVPTGRPVVLTMISEDMIHSFYIPAFRSKMDVLPGRYTVQWFEPTQTGTYHLFCAEYCGTDHSRMIGSVIVQTPEQYAQWLEDDEEEPPASRGRRLFQQYRCNDCHVQSEDRRGPPLTNLLGSQVTTVDGRTVTADLKYFRNSIRNPDDDVVAGYQAVMPPYPQITEEEILLIMAYLESVSAGRAEERASQQGAAPDAAAPEDQAPSESGNSEPGSSPPRENPPGGPSPQQPERQEQQPRNQSPE